MLESISDHYWYHDPLLVILSLCDNEMPSKKREKLAKAVYATERPANNSIGRPAARGLLDPAKEDDFWGLKENQESEKNFDVHFLRNTGEKTKNPKGESKKKRKIKKREWSVRDGANPMISLSSSLLAPT